MKEDRQFRFRSRVLRLGLWVLLLSLVLRLVYIQVAEAGELSDKAQDWIRVDRDIKGKRGAIYDRSGQKLAFTGVAYDINVDLEYLRDEKVKAKGQDTPESYAKFLSPLLGMTEQELLQSIDLSRKEHGIGLGPKSKKVDASIHEQIEKLHKEEKFLGINTIRADIRSYPNAEFAAHVLGYMGYNDKVASETGLAGVEYVYDNVLTGKPGKAVYYTDRDGNPLPTYQPEEKVPAVDGSDVVLTIDAGIQHFVEDELNQIVADYRPKHASIIVADPNNGEILAMGNRPAFHPAEYNKAEPEALWNNWALQRFEPGSTFKSFVLTAALAENKVDLSETFQSGAITVDGRRVSDWNNTGWGQITYRQSVYNSSNVGFVKMGQKLGKDTLYDYLYQFGFNKLTGIDLPGEAKSGLFDPRKMRDIDLATTSFGQGISVTPIQQVAAMSAIANGGKVYQPHVVKEFRDQTTGETVKEVKPKVLYEVANPEVMSTVRQVLEEAVREDINHLSYIPGYRVAGKTGTAEVPKPNGGYEENKYRLSFIGFAPANNPRLLIYVTIDQPSTNNGVLQFGSTMAGPPARNVLLNSLRYLQVPVDESDLAKNNEGKQEGAKTATPTPAEPKVFVKVPDLIGVTKDQAAQVAEQGKLKIDAVGDGPKVTGQWPDVSYGQVPEGTQIKLYFGPEGSKEGKVKMPDLTGLSKREAIDTLALLQLKIDPEGFGYVRKQSVPAGTLVPFGTAIKLEFGPQS